MSVREKACGRDFVGQFLIQMKSLKQGFEVKVLIDGEIIGNTNIKFGKGANMETIHQLVTAQGNCYYILLGLVLDSRSHTSD